MTALLAEAGAVLLTWQMAAAALATVVAGLMRGYAGFGTAVVLAPVFATLWGSQQGVALMLLLELTISAQLVPGAWRQAERRVVLPLAAAALLAMPAGTLILWAVEPDALRRGIGVVVLVLAFLLMSGWRYRGARPLWLNLAVGASSGLLKGATGMAGPPVTLYLLAGLEDAKRHRANLIVFFGLIAIASLLGPVLLGLVTPAVLAKLLVLLPVMALSVPVGARLLHVVPQRLYRPFAMAVMLMVGSLALLA